MKYVHLGRSGLTVSRVCLGMMSYGDRVERAWQLDEMEAEPIVRAAIEASLRRLGTDCGTLYQIHRFDYETPIAGNMAALGDVVRAGKVRSTGHSGFGRREA